MNNLYLMPDTTKSSVQEKHDSTKTKQKKINITNQKALSSSHGKTTQEIAASKTGP